MKVVPLLTAAVVSSATISTATSSDINAIINDKSNPHHHRRSGRKKNRNNNGQRRDLSTKSEKAITSKSGKGTKSSKGSKASNSKSSKSSTSDECAGSVCGAYLPCDGSGCPSGNGICATTSDDGVTQSGGLCIAGFTSCNQPTCSDGQCPLGSICLIDTCCGGPICAPPSSFCENTSQLRDVTEKTLPEGPTIGQL